MGVRFSVLGPLEVTVDGTLVDLPAGRPRRLLTALALRANSVVAAEPLMEALWDGRPPRSGAKALQGYVSQLRRVLPKGYLVTRPPGYVLVVSDAELDVRSFQRDAAAGLDALRAGDYARAAACLGDALAWWRSDEIADAPGDLRPELDRLREQRVAAMEEWFDARLALGDHGPVLASLRHAVDEHPYRERLVGQEMLALYRAGRHVDALDAFTRLRARLSSDLGLEPAPPLVDLQRAILAHDRALAEPAASRRAATVAPANLPAPIATFLMTDIEGSTALAAALGPGAWRAVLGEHNRLCGAVWAAHDGVVVKTEGDSFFVAFTRPADAVAAAVAAQRALGRHPWPAGHAVRVRMGIHTGEVEVVAGDYVGIEVHYAARVAAAAHGGQVLLSAAARALVPDALVRSLGRYALKDFPDLEELFQVIVGDVGSEVFAPPRGARAAITRLPEALTPLIGREPLVAELVARCSAEARVLSVVGPGGTGKTRLAVEVARRAAAEFDGVAFVPLAELTHSDDVAAAAQRALGLPDLPGARAVDRVVDHLRDRRTLLVLDNAEHVLDGVGSLTAAVTAVSRSHLLVTSQAPLDIGGEEIVRLDPLELPDPGERDLAAVAGNSSVALLLDRLRAAGSSFTLTAENVGDVAALCHRLEGMPLAIELAAARLELLGVVGLTRRLDAHLDALGTGARDLPRRQRGLRAVLEWTTGVLSDAQRALLGDLSVFAGGFDADLAEDAFGDVLDGLQTLLDVGLVRASSGGRLALRPPVRRYASDLLQRSGRSDAAHHAALAALVRIGEPHLRWGLIDGTGRPRLNQETSNVFALLDWTRDADPAAHARLISAVGWWAQHADVGQLAIGHLDLALQRVEDPAVRAGCLWGRGILDLSKMDPTRCLDAADAWHRLGDVDGEAMALAYASNLHNHAQRVDAAFDVIDRLERLADAHPANPGIRWLSDTFRAPILRNAGCAHEAEGLLRDLVARGTPGTLRDFWPSTALADVLLELNRPAEALPLYARAMDDVAELGMVSTELVQADTIAQALANLGRLRDAATALAVCEFAHRELSLPPFGSLVRALDHVRALLPTTLRAAGVTRAQALGLRDGLDHVRSLADA